MNLCDCEEFKWNYSLNFNGISISFGYNEHKFIILCFFRILMHFICTAKTKSATSTTRECDINDGNGLALSVKIETTFYLWIMLIRMVQLIKQLMIGGFFFCCFI